MEIPRTKRLSHKVPGLPRVRPCVKCGKEKRIEARGMCDACRKKQERLETVHGDQRQGDDLKGIENIVVIIRTMRKMKVARADLRAIVEKLMPYSGTSFNYQKAFVEQHCQPFQFDGDEIEVEDEPELKEASSAS